MEEKEIIPELSSNEEERTDSYSCFYEKDLKNLLLALRVQLQKVFKQ